MQRPARQSWNRAIEGARFNPDHSLIPISNCSEHSFRGISRGLGLTSVVKNGIPPFWGGHVGSQVVPRSFREFHHEGALDR